MVWGCLATCHGYGPSLWGLWAFATPTAGEQRSAALTRGDVVDAYANTCAIYTGTYDIPVTGDIPVTTQDIFVTTSDIRSAGTSDM
jgi:hypothetical protein